MPPPPISDLNVLQKKKKKKKQVWSQAISVLQNLPHVYSSGPNKQLPVILV